jgi:hypothetical protein
MSFIHFLGGPYHAALSAVFAEADPEETPWKPFQLAAVA